MSVDTGWLPAMIAESARQNRLRRLAAVLLKALGLKAPATDLIVVLDIPHEQSNLDAIHVWLSREHPDATVADRSDLCEVLNRRLMTWEMDRWLP